MEKRVILAIALSMLVLMVWSGLGPKSYQSDSQRVALQGNATIPTPPPPPLPLPITEPLAKILPTESLWKFNQGQFRIDFIESRGAIQSVIFKRHGDFKFPLRYGFLVGDPALEFKNESSVPGSATFVHRDKDKIITKKFIFSETGYDIKFELTINNLSTVPLSLSMPVMLGVLDFSGDAGASRYEDVAVAAQDKVKHFNARKGMSFENIKFISLRDRYFCAIVEPEEGNFNALINVNKQESEISLTPVNLVVAPLQENVQRFRIYLGPQDLKLINRINPAWTAVIYYGFFDSISHILLQILEWIYLLVHNYGIAIILLSLVVYLVLYPFTIKQMRSMKAMQELQPKIEALRQMYKDSPQRLNKEMLELYKTHKVNPLGGCLPLVLQMPIFFALYQALTRSILLKGANFLWIKDLSEPDKLLVIKGLPTNFPVISNELNILPILMAICMFIQQKSSLSSAATGTAAEQQKIMLIVMPVMFGFLFYRMPSGLVLYWLVNSIITCTYQLKISRHT